MSDNLSVNQKTFKLFHDSTTVSGVSSITHPFPNPKFPDLFTLYDPTHLFKNVRNNWLTEKCQTLEFIDPDTNETCLANWKHLVEVYNSELESDLKAMKIDFKTNVLTILKSRKFILSVIYLMIEHTLCWIRKKGWKELQNLSNWSPECGTF